MRVADEPNVDLLRKKAVVLERENERLSSRLAAMYRENLQLKGMAPEQIEQNLPGLLSKVTSPEPARSSLTRPGSERRSSSSPKPDPKPQTGHGPTEQTDIAHVHESWALAETDRTCTTCGGELEEWEGQADEVGLVDIVERQWVMKHCSLPKYRCKCGCLVSAPGPQRLIKGGRYTSNVAVAAAAGKYLDHIPLERQVAQAQRLGLKLTSQALWDQVDHLSELILPVVQRIRTSILSEPVVGVDESPFLLIRKGGSKKWQAWQVATPRGAYFEILRAKSQRMGERLLGDYSGVVVADGAGVYVALSRDGPFSLVNCWSHARRRVLKAEGEAPAQVAEFLELVGELYAIEREAVIEAPSDGRSGYRHLQDLELLATLRDTKSREVVSRLQAWILAQRCVPNGELKKSLDYVAKRWTPLTCFLDDARIPLDNNDVERGYIGLAIGRRNYVGARSVDGARAAARFYTIFETAKRSGVDPAAYLKYATDELLRNREPALPGDWQ